MAEFIPYEPIRFSDQDQEKRALEFLNYFRRRRSVREFSNKPVPRALLETLIRSAGTAPSGANKQPWKFVIVTDSKLKKEIRTAAEKEEQESYTSRMPEEWLRDLEPLGVDWIKPFLETAPALIAVF